MDSVLELENRLISQPNYVFNCTDTIGTVKVMGASDDEVLVGWPNVWGADEYDLEWTRIDSSSLLRYQSQPDKVFENNATRVTVTKSSYKIPLLYEDSGMLFVRVRPIHYKSDGTRVEVHWSKIAGFGFGGHERNLNWQSTITFAEEGKRKAVVQYYDGSLRSRQTVTRDNSRDSIIVAETYYDYQGRPVIQVLPAPSLSSIIHYSRNFNVGLNGAEYDKDQYDALNDPSEYCNKGANAMKTDSGASRYYSPNNGCISNCRITPYCVGGGGATPTALRHCWSPDQQRQFGMHPQ